MNVETHGNTLVLTGVSCFNVSQILECGQCFRFEKLSENHYRIIALGKALEIRQESSFITLTPCTAEEFDIFWKNYFDLNRDYAQLQQQLSQNDPIMEAAIAHAPGIRVLNQEFWEMVISFIISQNNRIPMIKKVIENISKTYGTPIDGGFAFPEAKQLADVSIDELMLLKTGFRAKYIKDAVEKKLTGRLNEININTLPTLEARKQLIAVYGIGDKVADCIMLFGMGRSDVFPADVWIKRVISQLYYNGENIALKELQAFASDKWGENAGLAQQYLFHYARLNKIGA